MEDLILRAAIIDELSAPLDEIRHSLKRVEDATKKAATAAKAEAAAMTTAGSAARRTAGETDRLAAAKKRAAEMSKHMNDRIDGLVRGAGSRFLQWTKRATQAMGALAVAGSVFGVRTALDVQDATIAFEGMLGSASKAKRLLAEIRGLDATKALGFGTTTEAASLLGSFGLDPTRLGSTITSLTDAAYARGGKGAAERFSRIALVVGQIKAKGRLQAEELMQLAEAGVPLTYDKLGKAIGSDASGVMKAMTTPEGATKLLAQLGGAEGIAELIGSGSVKGAAGRNMRKSLRGLAKSTLEQFGLAASDALQPYLASVTAWLGKNQDRITGLASRAVGWLVRQLPMVIRYGKSVAKSLREVAITAGPVIRDALRVAVPLVLGFVAGIGALAVVLRPISGLIVPIASGLAAFMVIGRVATMMRGFTLAWAALNVVMLANPAVAIAAAVVALGAALYIAYQRSEMLRDSLAKMDRLTKRVTDNPVGAGAVNATGPLGIGLRVGSWVRRQVAGDTASPRASTLRGHSAAASMAGGGFNITSGVRNFGLGSPNSDHFTGHAVDVTGPNLQSYVSSARSLGAYADIHGSGASRHAHTAWGDTASPRAGSGGGGGDTFIFEMRIGSVDSAIEFERIARRVVADAHREREIAARER